MSDEIFAHHAHVFPPEVRPDGTIDRLKQLMDECGIARAVCFAPFSHQVKDAGIDPNRWLAGAIASEPRLVGFGTVDFKQGDPAGQVRRIRDLGFAGIKLHPAAQQFDVLSEQALAVYAEAEQLGLFLTFHTGIHWHRLRDYHVIHFDEIAYRFPRLRLSLEHVGGYHFFNEALAVIVNTLRWRDGRRESNVYAGLTSVFNPENQRYWYLTRDKIEELIAQTGVDQLIFGLDFPYNKEPETRQALRAIDALGLSAEDRRKVLGGNLARLLHADGEADLEGGEGRVS